MKVNLSYILFMHDFLHRGDVIPSRSRVHVVYVGSTIDCNGSSIDCSIDGSSIVRSCYIRIYAQLLLNNITN